MTRTIGLLLLTILTLITSGCGDKTSKTTDIDPLFQDFLNGIPKKSLPINLSCGLPNELISSDGFEKYKSFIPKSARAFGTVDSGSENFRLVIYGYIGDDIYPVLFSFNNKGQIIDSLNLILNPCGAADDKVIPHSFVIIDNELTIDLIDTTSVIHYPGYWKSINDLASDLSTKFSDSTFIATGDYIIDSLRISRQVFNIDKKGQFVKQ